MVVVGNSTAGQRQRLVIVRDQRMPTLFRFLTVIAVIGGIIYGTIYALANFVGPKTREITVVVPPDKFLKK